MKRLPTMKQLEYLVALADTRHFRRAAERCHITQSTLSAGIRDLESVLGTAVAERSNRHVLMTRVGTTIAGRAKALLREAEEMMEIAKANRAPMTGELRLGVIPTIGPFLLPRVLPALRERFPELTIYLREEQTVPLLVRLEDGEVDAALIALPCETGDLAVEDIFEDEFLFACNRSHALAGAEAVPPDALEGEPLMLLEEGHCLRGHALDVCGAGNTKARAQFEASSLHTLVQMVAAGIGVTLVPRIAVEARIAQGTGISLAPLSAPASRRIGLAWRCTSLRAKEFRLLAGALRDVAEVA
ncbi:MAG: LysR substrate-binding domain-containing protein [Alphaproteobacteria bacterium]|nr:LysR substrate-binding domain-containing protein [Alphaproteobacteria bacterium]MCY3755938.1 LysR substrate-binding domain-containing protein [Alphaproteobacteria bacterium]